MINVLPMTWSIKMFQNHLFDHVLAQQTDSDTGGLSRLCEVRAGPHDHAPPPGYGGPAGH